MPRIKIPNCRCGVLKTIENTTTRFTESGIEHFNHLCKKCDAKRAHKQRMQKLSTDKLKELREYHITHLNSVLEELCNRSDL